MSFGEEIARDMAWQRQLEAALSLELDKRRKLASMSETVMRCVLELEEFAQASKTDGLDVASVKDNIEHAAKKLRAAVLAAT